MTLPATTPITIGSHHTRRIVMSTAPRRDGRAWNERIEVGMMIASEVPMQSGMRTSSGTPASRKHS